MPRRRKEMRKWKEGIRKGGRGGKLMIKREEGFGEGNSQQGLDEEGKGREEEEENEGGKHDKALGKENMIVEREVGMEGKGKNERKEGD